jgi:hypothetical protein
MPTLKLTTSSNQCRVDPNSKDQIETIADEYDFCGEHDELNIDVKENSDGNTIISIHGYASFAPTKPICDEDGSVVDREHEYAEEFLKRIAPHLEGQLVIETVGHKKCSDRSDFPLLAGQWSVWPDGTVQYDSLDHSPEKPEASDEDAQFGVLNTERDLLLKLGQFGPAFTSDRDKAIEKAGGDHPAESHLAPVRVETIPVADEGESQ